MAKLSEKYPREAEVAKNLLAPLRLFSDGDGNGSLILNRQRVDDLEMKICEALVEAGAHERRKAWLDAQWSQ